MLRPGSDHAGKDARCCRITCHQRRVAGFRLAAWGPRVDRATVHRGFNRIAAFSIGQGYLLGVTVYVLLPSLMLFLSLVLPVKVTRMANIVVALVYALTIVGSAVGEWTYFILGSLIEAALLIGIAYYAWTWPKAADTVATPSDRPRDGSRAQPAMKVRSSDDVPLG
jgi:hypothetical protein